MGNIATLFTDDGCAGTRYAAAVGVCVEASGGRPLVKAFVECPFSDK